MIKDGKSSHARITPRIEEHLDAKDLQRKAEIAIKSIAIKEFNGALLDVDSYDVVVLA